MDIRPRQLAVAAAIAAAGFLGVGALTAASAQDSGDDTTSTTVEEQPNADDNSTSSDDGSGSSGQSGDARSDEDCPYGEGRGGPGNHRGDRGDNQEEEEAPAS